MASSRGVLVAVGFVAVVGGCVAAAVLVPRGESTVRFVVVVAVVGCFAAIAGDVGAAIVTAGMAWPFYVGFLDGRLGELRWDGAASLAQLGVLGGVALLGSASGRAREGAVGMLHVFYLWVVKVLKRRVQSTRWGRPRNAPR